MKKWLLFFLVFFQFTRGDAQNWRCFPDTMMHYFTNDKNYLRCSYNFGVAFPDSTYYFSFCTLRGLFAPIGGDPIPLNPGPNWLGDSVTMNNDGTFLFFNMWSDTIILKTQANIGDSWLFYTDSSIYSYRATVISIDTMTVLDSLDSVKTIQINAYASGVLNPADSLNGFQLKISKKYGFVQVFDLYTFPYHFSSYVDYFYTSAGPYYTDQIFKLIKYHSPTQLEIYDFNPGDFFERKTTTELSWMYPCVGTNYSSLFIDSVITKAIIDPTHTEYTVHHYGCDTNGTVYGSYDEIDTITVSSAIMYITAIPEQCNDVLHYYYYPSDSSFCFNSNIHASTGPIIFGGYSPYPDCFINHEYKEGFGEIQKVTGIGGTPGCDEAVTAIMTERLVFAVKNGDSCGTYLLPSPSPVDSSAAVNKLTQQTNYYALYPNPTTTSLTITSGDKISSIAISNLVGQTVYRHQYNTENVQIDVSNLPPGIYFIKINGTEVRKFVKE